MDLKQQLDETRLQAMEGMDISWMLEQAMAVGTQSFESIGQIQD